MSDGLKQLFKAGSEADHVVSTAETIFYAQGGGQPSDTGLMKAVSGSASRSSAEFAVSLVRRAPDGQILHLGRFISADATAPTLFAPGEQVDQAIDGAKRDLHSRIHTAGHIVGLAVRHLQKGAEEGDGLSKTTTTTAAPAVGMPAVTELKAQHYPDASFVEFRGLIDGSFKEAIQAQARRFVDQQLPVKVYWWPEIQLRERCVTVPDATIMPDRDHGGLARAVDIVGAGAYPCGGTHVPHTGHVGTITVRKISRTKGITKISYAIESPGS